MDAIHRRSYYILSNMRPSIEQMKNMRYGMVFFGSYVHIKLRFTASLLERMIQDPELKQFAQDLTIVYNKVRTHGHIAGVFHRNSGFVDILYRVRKRQETKLQVETLTLFSHEHSS